MSKPSAPSVKLALLAGGRSASRSSPAGSSSSRPSGTTRRTEAADRRHAGSDRRSRRPRRTSAGRGKPPIRVADLFKLSRAMPDTRRHPWRDAPAQPRRRRPGSTFESITPHDPVSLGAYQQIEVDLSFEGRFYDLSDFLYRLRNLVGVHRGVLDATGRLFTVDAIAFDQGDAQVPPGEGDADRLGIRLRRRDDAASLPRRATDAERHRTDGSPATRARSRSRRAAGPTAAGA